MPDTHETASTRTTKWIQATPEALYRAFTDPEALAAWQAPEAMTGTIHQFDGQVGGGYQMSLYYPASEPASHGKTTEREDRYTARFVELAPPHKIVEAITFETVDSAFQGEMLLEVTLEAMRGGTRVCLVYTNIPLGIRPEDNVAGTQESLAKLARYVEAGASQSDGDRNPTG